MILQYRKIFKAKILVILTQDFMAFGTTKKTPVEKKPTAEKKN